MHANIVLRSKVISAIRRRMVDLGFMEYQTPTLTASSPEGARDFLVPARRHPGKFYALPQAPQMFKQIIMVSGFDRYFQIAPCYRDEDSRADRSPGEFYQLDLEMSFVTQDDVFEALEKLFTGLFAEFRPDRVMTAAPFPRFAYEEAMRRFGSDKPDLRNPLDITDLTALFAKSGFKAFAGKIVRAMRIPEGAKQTRSFFDKLEERAKRGRRGGTRMGAGRAGQCAQRPDHQVPFRRKRSPRSSRRPARRWKTRSSSFPIRTWRRSAAYWAALRTHLGQALGLIEENVYKFCWIVDFPMYEFDAEHGKIDFSHNPFSMPQGGLEALNTKDPLTIKAFQYDIVCNGYRAFVGRDSESSSGDHVPRV